MSRHILVIKLGAFGDFVQALGPLSAIRRHHAEDRLTLLTTAPYADFAAASGLVDDIWIDTRPRLAAVGQWLGLRHRLRTAGIKRVYDLQTSDRRAWYYRLFWPGPRPEWSGIAPGCSHPHANPARDTMHTVERQREQLAIAGIAEVPAPDLAWARADLAGFALPAAYTLLVPGGAAHRPAKRWPPARYVALAETLRDQGTPPVLIGGADEAALLDEIAAAVPGALNLAGRTDLLELAELARGATAAVGNDTGPMHLIAAAGCRAVVLYSHASDPALCAQRGPAVTILRRPDLADLSVDEVARALQG